MAERRQAATESIQGIIRTYFKQDYEERKRIHEEELVEFARYFTKYFFGVRCFLWDETIQNNTMLYFHFLLFFIFYSEMMSLSFYNFSLKLRYFPIIIECQLKERQRYQFLCVHKLSQGYRVHFISLSLAIVWWCDSVWSLEWDSSAWLSACQIMSQYN